MGHKSEIKSESTELLKKGVSEGEIQAMFLERGIKITLETLHRWREEAKIPLFSEAFKKRLNLELEDARESAILLRFRLFQTTMKLKGNQLLEAIKHLRAFSKSSATSMKEQELSEELLDFCEFWVQKNLKLPVDQYWDFKELQMNRKKDDLK